jgi:hypothetical protein
MPAAVTARGPLKVVAVIDPAELLDDPDPLNCLEPVGMPDGHPPSCSRSKHPTPRFVLTIQLSLGAVNAHLEAKSAAFLSARFLIIYRYIWILFKNSLQLVRTIDSRVTWFASAARRQFAETDLSGPPTAPKVLPEAALPLAPLMLRKRPNPGLRLPVSLKHGVPSSWRFAFSVALCLVENPLQRASTCRSRQPAGHPHEPPDPPRSTWRLAARPALRIGGVRRYQRRDRWRVGRRRWVGLTPW